MKAACGKAPCPSCPYRQDVPSGVWDASEYVKLEDYDRPTREQPVAAFMCHQQDGRLCAGWVGCHGDELLALRLMASRGKLDPSVLTYGSPVPLFASGSEAAKHGLRDIKHPGHAARRLAATLVAKAAKRRRKVAARAAQALAWLAGQPVSNGGRDGSNDPD